MSPVRHIDVTRGVDDDVQRIVQRRRRGGEGRDETVRGDEPQLVVACIADIDVAVGVGGEAEGPVEPGGADC